MVGPTNPAMAGLDPAISIRLRNGAMEHPGQARPYWVSGAAMTVPEWCGRMTVLHSDIDPRSAEFAANAAAMRALVDDLRERVAEVGQGGGKTARDATSPATSCCPASEWRR